MSESNQHADIKADLQKIVHLKQSAKLSDEDFLLRCLVVLRNAIKSSQLDTNDALIIIVHDVLPYIDVEKLVPPKRTWDSGEEPTGPFPLFPTDILETLINV